MNRSAKELLIVATNLYGLVWRIADDSNFLPAKLSRYTVYVFIIVHIHNLDIWPILALLKIRMF